MIGRIVIENYKSIESLSLDLGRVTVLIGANGSGKSNILEAIALCSAAAANKLDNEFLFARGIRVSDDPRHMRSAFDKSNVAKNINIALMEHSAADKDEINVPIFACQLRNDNLVYSKWIDQIREILTDSAVNKIIEEMKNESKESQIAKQPPIVDMTNFVTNSYHDTVGQAIEPHGLNNFLMFVPENTTLRDFEKPGQIQPLGIRGEGLLKLLTVLARPENANRLAEIQERLQLLDWFGEFQIGGNVALGERTLRIRDQYLDGDLAYFTQRSANEGFLFLLFYFTLFVAKETPRFFAVDNIDASLNPKLCAELLRQLCELAAKYDKQVIVTTHNPAILDGLNLRDDSQRLYVVERDLEGRTQARRIEPRGDGESGDGRKVRLSEAFLRGYIGGLPLNF